MIRKEKIQIDAKQKEDEKKEVSNKNNNNINHNNYNGFKLHKSVDKSKQSNNTRIKKSGYKLAKSKGKIFTKK